MSNAKWKIVPVEPTPEMIAAADKACASQFPTNKEYFLAEYPAALATAPEPDWEALAETMRELMEAAIVDVNLHAMSDAEIGAHAKTLYVNALRATFGSKPQQSEIVK